MYSQINRLCTLELLDHQLYGHLGVLTEKIVDVANFFGFLALPDEYKIKLRECNEPEFRQVVRQVYIGQMDYIVAFTCDANRIYVLSYANIKDRYSLRSYIGFIVHECVHVLYAYFSRLPFNRYAWLYESIACYLAKQEKTYSFNEFVPWERFTDNFYIINECYALAYNYGRLLFDYFGEDILNALKNPLQSADKFMYVYNSKLWGL